MSAVLVEVSPVVASAQLPAIRPPLEETVVAVFVLSPRARIERAPTRVVSFFVPVPRVTPVPSRATVVTPEEAIELTPPTPTRPRARPRPFACWLVSLAAVRLTFPVGSLMLSPTRAEALPPVKALAVAPATPTRPPAPALAVALELAPDEGLAIAAPTARVPMPEFDRVGTGKVTGARPAADLFQEI